MAIVTGTAYWASVTTPNTTYEPVYTVNLVVDEDTAQSFRSQGHTVKDMDEGPALIIKRKVNGPNGMVRSAPKLVDATKNPIDERIGNGSAVKIQYKEWESVWKGKTFKGLDFQAMQVLDLVSVGSADGGEFDVEDEMEEAI
jgi:hypothetical protein|tara:strand:+ start:5468 stop:5893 length:426 start_codon:yes stop_codon:yes gene_type:complete